MTGAVFVLWMVIVFIAGWMVGLWCGAMWKWDPDDPRWRELAEQQEAEDVWPYRD